MPKRAPTPPPADDSRLFTVVNPYPEQPYLALEDSKRFARWIACIVGEEHLLAFHHKPKSPNTVIIEVSKTGPDFRKLMGEHRWNEVLKKPSSAEACEVSYIFPCTLITTRAVEKAGWLCRDVASSWFRRWSPETDSSISYPYPQPRHCEPPSEDITRYPLCRPIPKRTPNARDSASRPVLRTATPIRVSSPSTTSTDGSLTPTTTSEFSDLPSTPPPGLAAVARFVPVIHGSDVPKASDIIVALSGLSRAQPPDVSKAENDSADEEEEAEKNLCRVHGALCVSGICKECAARKREERFAERARQREQERKRRGNGRRDRGRDWERGQGRGRLEDHTTRVMEMPPHLKTCAAAAKGASVIGAGEHRRAVENPKSRLRDDIRIEMAGRKHGASKSAASTIPRPMPAHLLKGAAKGPQNAGSFSSNCKLTESSSSTSTASGSVMPSTYAVSDDDDHSQASSESHSSHGVLPQMGSGSQNGPWGTGIDWRAYAGIREGDEDSVATGATGDAFRNPWRHSPSKQAVAHYKWADAVEETLYGSGVRAAWDDDGSSDEGFEPF